MYDFYNECEENFAKNLTTIKKNLEMFQTNYVEGFS